MPRFLLKYRRKSFDTIVVAIPFLNGLGHTMETIDVEFEWKPPRCDTCKIFMHNDNQCPKAAKVAGPIKASDDRFVKVTCKHEKDNKETDIPKHKQNNKKSSPLEEVNFASLKNPFASLKDKEYIFRNNDETWRNTNDIGSSKHDSDSEEVKNVFVKNATFMGGKINTKKVKVPLKKTAHYFDKDDMEFDDMGYAVEEVEHENAYWFSYDY
ncbi:hypothetical protein Tco_0492452 [Tanacetum coccineum]